MNKLIILICLFSFNTTFAQEPLDSLKKALLNSKNQIETLNEITDVFSQMGQNDSTLFYAEKTILLANKPGFEKELARAYQHTAEAYDAKSNFKLSTDFAFKALKLGEQINDPLTIASASKEIGFSFLRSGNGPKTREWLLKATEQFKKAEQFKYVALCYMTIGNSYHLENKDKEGYPYFEKALAEGKKLKDEYVINMVKSNYAVNLGNAGDYAKAIELSTSTIPFFESTGDPSLYATEYVNLCDYYGWQKNYPKSIYYGEKALEILQKHEVWGPLKSVAVNLSEIYEEIGDTKNALKCMKIKEIAKDSLNTMEIKDRTETLELKYEAENKSLEIENLNASLKNKQLQQFLLWGGIISLILIGGGIYYNNRLLNSKNKEIDSQNKKIEQLNTNLEKKVEERTSELQDALNEVKEAMAKGQSSERKRLASDLHDNLGSVLSAINMNLEALDPKSLTERERKLYSNVKNMTSDAYNEVRHISHNLSPKVLETEGLESALNRLVEKMNLSDNVDYVLYYKLTTPIKDRLKSQLYAIAMEILNNISKHAKAKNASLTLEENNGKIRMIAQDNGIGFDKQKQNGFGLTSIKERIVELDGTIDIKSFKNEGSLISIVVANI
ncbi:hypothetical protein EGI22_19045 [Lacihabitans sp. LS3-19]|uniref:histidine kinase n=1 Tax=Lacihabitans sp. LS3-19 TaxID=2487335 RepID=UPI0020CBE07F|nr:histidine kinase [Lacihabitans sp. LS3-19]MCP9770004.1 hypothetical protein [Lacihabitans sp. LS3-19]